MSHASPFDDHSIAALSGSSEELFPARDWGSVIERFVTNPNPVNAIAVNLAGGAAALNTAGSVILGPRESISFINTNAVNVIGTASEDVTAYERLGG